MATRRRNREPAVEESLLKEGHRFDFFQAVRLLERGLKEGEPSVGEQSVPEQERIRFRSRVRMDFPASDVNKVIAPRGDETRHEVDTNFLPIGGFNGPLPQPYVQTLLDRTKRRDFAMRDFIDIFHHRLVSIFYRIRKKHRVALDLSHPGRTHFARYFLSFLGLGTRGMTGRLGGAAAGELTPVAGAERKGAEETARLKSLLNPWPGQALPVDDRALIRFAGLLNQRPRSAVGLEKFLGGHFRVPVKVRQFAGQWHALDEDQYSSIGRLGRNNRLGVDVTLGTKVWDNTSRVEIELGPLDAATQADLLPSGTGFASLCALARFYLGDAVDFDVRYRLAAGQTDRVRLGAGTRLGWTSWLSTAARDGDDSQAIVRPRFR
jgi:type VI secretion system protein ImpH